MNQKHFFRRIGLSVIAGALCLTAFALSGFAQSTVTLNVTGAVNPIPRELFGTLMERLGRQWGGPKGSSIEQGAIWVGTSSTIPHVNGMRKDVLDGLKECGLGCAQWPGGCAAVGYNWNPPNPANEVGTDRFLEFCQYIGCEPIFAGPHVSGSAAGAANSNLNWIRHIDSVTAQRGMDSLKWFKIGNEVWGGCGNGVDVATYAANFEVNYAKIHAYRPSLMLEACNSMEGGGVPAWQTSLFTAVGTHMNGLEYHDYIYYPSTYPSDVPSDAQYWQIMYDCTVGDFAGHLKNDVIPSLVKNDPNKTVKLVVDEWGDWLKSDGNWMQTATVMDALSAANHLHLMMNYTDRIGAACLAQGVSVIHSLININTNAVSTKTPTFYLFKMLKPHHERGAKWIPATTSTIQTFTQTAAGTGSVTLPVLTLGSTVDNTGRVNISVSNIDKSATRQLTINLTSNVAQYAIDSAQIVTGAAINSSNPFGAAEVVNLQNFAATNYTLTNNGKTLTATLPARSIVMFRLIPPTSIQSGIIRTHGSNAFSVKDGSHGTVLISSTMTKKTPVTISLYSVNGRTLLNKVSKTFEPGTSSFTLNNGRCDNGVYIVKIVGEDVNLSQKLVVGK